MRDKEILQDYRFMPEPNLPPIRICDGNDSPENYGNLPNIEEIKKKLPILPETERLELLEKYKLPLREADRIVVILFKKYISASIKSYFVLLRKKILLNFKL